MYSLINQLQKKDEQALREVINRYGGYVKAIVLKVLQPNHTAIEECINDVFLTIWQKSMQFTGDEVDFKNGLVLLQNIKRLIHTEAFKINQNSRVTPINFK